MISISQETGNSTGLELRNPLIKKHDARFEVFTAIKIQVAFFWVVAPCSEIENKRFTP
jgi:hypothetical protein